MCIYLNTYKQQIEKYADRKRKKNSELGNKISVVKSIEEALKKQEEKLSSKSPR